MQCESTRVKRNAKASGYANMGVINYVHEAVVPVHKHLMAPSNLNSDAYEIMQATVVCIPHFTLPTPGVLDIGRAYQVI